jgi:glycosyltransferase involved in cell wall biosynthesis
MNIVKPDISIIIPSYNHARYVEAAVHSVLTQTFRNFELIVIDDGSSDGSQQLLERLAASDARMTVVCQENGGSHLAINNGLKRAQAPWLAILNSDDVWTPNRLEVMLGEARSTGADFLFSDVHLMDGDGVEITDPSHWWNVSIERFRQRVVERGVCDGLLYGNLTVSTSNFVFKKELLAKVGLFKSYRYNLDWDFVLRCLFTDGVNVRFVPERLLKYRLHGRNAILSGMPRAALEAQAITRTLLRKHFGVPESLVLSDQRHDRLLRKFLKGRAKRFEESFKEVQADRDQLAQTMLERQSMIEAERSARTDEIEAIRADLSLLEGNRDELANLLNERQRIVENERSHFATLQAQSETLILHKDQALENAQKARKESYRRGVLTALERDVSRCRGTKMEDLIADYNAHPRRWITDYFTHMVDRLAGRVPRRDALPLEEQAHFGAVRQTAIEDLPKTDGNARVAVHLHLYYKDLAPELFDLIAGIQGLSKVVITGPWDRASLAHDLDVLLTTGADIHVAQVPNRGKDVGGLIHAIKEHELLDSDYLLKIHSKKSYNPDTYFEAISALFGTRIENGDQWRRALIEPLAGNATRINDILGALESDRKIGMVGAGPFITTAPDANAELYARTCEKLVLPTGMPFVAGTMFWVRSSLLAPLLDDMIDLNDFDLDSRAVEGGMEHTMERLFGTFALAKGFDLLGVR